MVKVVDSPSGGPRGKGRVEVIDNTNVRITITDREEKTSIHDLEFSQGVDMAPVGNWKLQSVEDVFIQLTQDKEEIQYIRPRNGTFYVEFAQFGAEEGELPTIRYDEGGKPFPGAKWENPARYKCYPLYEIINLGPYQGMEVLDVLTYEFEYDENLEEFAVVGSVRRKWHEHLLTVLGVFGFDLQHDDLLYTAEEYDADGPVTIPNVLPQLEDIFRSRKKLGQVTLNDGWIDSKTISNGPFGMTKESLQAAMAAQG
jgi:hypothetical protein